MTHALKRVGLSACLLVCSACSDAPESPARTPMGSRKPMVDEDGGDAAERDAGTDRPRIQPAVFTPGDAVDSLSIARNVLWAWTTDEELTALRAHPLLLEPPDRDNAASAKMNSVIDALADTGNALALVLTGGAFQKGRVAWTNVWATLHVWPGEAHGDRLLRIVLKPDALIVVLDGTTFSVVDMQDQPVAIEAVLGTPERIAAIYYVNRGESKPDTCSQAQRTCVSGAFREYFVDNEAMVQEWSFGTQAIRDELERSVELMQALRDGIGSGTDTDACEFSRAALCTWVGHRGFGTFGTYVSGLVISSDAYALTPANMDTLQKGLSAARFDPDPFVHRP
jgi:hypothetical protein